MSKIKTNDYVYHGKNDKKVSKNDFTKLFVIVATIVVFVALFVVLSCIERTMANKLVVENNSSQDISMLRFWYEDENGEITEVLELGEVDSGEDRKESTEKMALSKLAGEAWLSVYISFKDGGEAILQTGHFLNGFEGKISFEITDTDGDELSIRLKAGEGLFNSASVTGCDDVYYINPKNGYIE